LATGQLCGEIRSETAARAIRAARSAATVGVDDDRDQDYRWQFERDFNLIYAKAARDPVELWDLPDVNHTKTFNERPAQYERRVVAFFDRALLTNPGT
jgi:hypothetical protein